jgi:hypothetical protein
LRDALARYVDAARRAGGGARRPARGSRRGPSGGLDTTEVREWARAQGIEVKTAAGYPPTCWPSSRPHRQAGLRRSHPRGGCGALLTCRIAVTSHGCLVS